MKYGFALLLLIVNIQTTAQSQRFNADLYTQGNILANPEAAYFPGIAAGYRFALEAGYPLGRFFEARAGLGYAGMGFSVENRSTGSSNSQSLRFLEVPVMVRFVSDPADDGDAYRHFYAELGIINTFPVYASWRYHPGSIYTPAVWLHNLETVKTYVPRAALGFGIMVGSPMGRFVAGGQFSSAFRTIYRESNPGAGVINMPMYQFGVRLGIQFGIPAVAENDQTAP